MSGAGLAFGAVDAAIDSGRTAAELILLTPQAMRARRHPRAVAAVWAWEAVLAALASAPAASLVRAAWHGGEGDAPLWTTGGHALLDWLWHDSHGVHAALSGAEIVLGIAAVAGLVPMAALLVTLAYARRDRRAAGFVQSVAGGLRAFPAMAVLFVLVGLLQGIVVLAGALLAYAVEGAAHAGMGEAHAQELEGAVLLFFLAPVSGLGVMHDLARAAVIRFRVTGLRALALGARALRSSPVRLWWSWAWRALASLAPVLAAAALAGTLGGRGGVPLLCLLLLHQSVVTVRVALRASWLARALRAVDAPRR